MSMVGFLYCMAGVVSYLIWACINAYTKECIRQLPDTEGHSISKFKLLILKWIFSDALIPGNQENNLAIIHKLLFNTSYRIYNEDNNITHVDFTTECYQRALDENGIGIAVKLATDNNPNHIIEVARK